MKNQKINLFYSFMVYRLVSGGSSETPSQSKSPEIRTEIFNLKDSIREKKDKVAEQMIEGFEKFKFPERYKEKYNKLLNGLNNHYSAFKSEKFTNLKNEEDIKTLEAKYINLLKEITDKYLKLVQADVAFKIIYDAMEKKHDQEKERLFYKYAGKMDKRYINYNEIGLVVRSYLLRWHIAYFNDLASLSDEKIVQLSKTVGEKSLNIGNMDNDLKDIENQLDRVVEYWNKGKETWNRRVYSNKKWEGDKETLYFPKGYKYKEKGYTVVKTPDWGEGAPDKIESELKQNIEKEEINQAEKLAFTGPLNSRNALRDKFKEMVGSNADQKKLIEELSSLVPDAAKRLETIAKTSKWTGDYPLGNILRNWPDNQQKNMNFPILTEEIRILTEGITALNKKREKEKFEADLNKNVEFQIKDNNLTLIHPLLTDSTEKVNYSSMFNEVVSNLDSGKIETNTELFKKIGSIEIYFKNLLYQSIKENLQSNSKLSNPQIKDRIMKEFASNYRNIVDGLYLTLTQNDKIKNYTIEVEGGASLEAGSYAANKSLAEKRAKAAIAAMPSAIRNNKLVKMVPKGEVFGYDGAKVNGESDLALRWKELIDAWNNDENLKSKDTKPITQKELEEKVSKYKELTKDDEKTFIKNNFLANRCVSLYLKPNGTEGTFNLNFKKGEPAHLPTVPEPVASAVPSTSAAQKRKII